MRTPKPLENHSHPAGNQPRRHGTLWIHLQRGSVKAALASPPVLQNQKHCPDHRIHRVLNIRNQLLGKKGKRPAFAPAEKSGYGDPSLPEGIQINGVPPVRLHRLVAISSATNRARRPQVAEKIDPASQEGSFVFPNRRKTVNVEYLNRALPGSREGGTLWPSKPSGSLSRVAWLFLYGQFLTSLFRPLLYHRSIQSANLASPPLRIMWSSTEGTAPVEGVKWEVGL